MAFLAGVLDITVTQGDYFEKVFTFSEGTPSVPRNLTGHAVAAQIRLNVADSSPFLTLTGALVNPALGQFKVSATVAQTQAMLLTELETFGVWDLELTPPDGKTFKVVRGQARLLAEVTR